MSANFILQSASLTGPQPATLHVAMIMDGNGRWATTRGLPRLAGHRSGAQTVRRMIETAPSLGVSDLTLYAFSSDNWKRPRTEVDGLFRLFEEHLIAECDRCVEKGVRISVIGRRDRLPSRLMALIDSVEAATRALETLHVRIAVDYSSRYSIAQAGFRSGSTDESIPDVDLLIRTGGEQRLSDFLLWESAYAELYFDSKMWPDYQAEDLERAVAAFHGRERRFGRIKMVS